MSTFPYQTPACVSLNIATTAIKDAYATTSLGASAAFGAYPRLAANLALTFGTVTTYTARITVQTTPDGPWKPALSLRRDNATEAAEHAMTSGSFSDLVCTKHVGSIAQRIEVKANVVGGLGDAVYAALVASAP